MEQAGWMIGQAGEDVGEPGLRIDAVQLRGLDQGIHRGRAFATRSDPAKVQLWRPTAIPRSARSAALLLRQMRPSTMKRVSGFSA